MKTSVHVFLALCAAFFAAAGAVLFKAYVYFDAFTLSDVLCACCLPHLPAAMHAMTVSQLAFKVWASTLTLVTLIAFAAGSSAGNLSKEFPFVFRLAAWCRTPMLMFIVVPLSFTMRLLAEFQIWYDIQFPDNSLSHEDKVQHVVDQVKAWNDGGRKNMMRTARPNWASMSTKLSSNKVG